MILITAKRSYLNPPTVHKNPKLNLKTLKFPQPVLTQTQYHNWFKHSPPKQQIAKIAKLKAYRLKSNSVDLQNRSLKWKTAQMHTNSRIKQLVIAKFRSVFSNRSTLSTAPRADLGLEDPQGAGSPRKIIPLRIRTSIMASEEPGDKAKTQINFTQRNRYVVF